jgi:hypothetical protein
VASAVITTSAASLYNNIETMKAMNKKSPPLLEGMDEDIPAGEDMTMT